MAALNPDHLFDQAERLIAPPPAGPPRQVDLRRAISSAYYGVFHFTLTALADQFVGRTLRGTPAYELVYRSIDHRAFKTLCLELQKTPPAARYQQFLPPDGIGADIQALATIAADLQERRHRADYNPTPRFKTADAQLAVTTARNAVDRFNRSSAARRTAFLTLLLCPPR